MQEENKNLSNYDAERISRFYTHAFEIYGENDARALQWSEASGQRRRFDVLLDIINNPRASLLDVGCGLGDLYPFLAEKNFKLNYTGIDIIPKFINSAQKRFPEASFEKKSVFEIEEMFDYIVASGAMSFKVENNQAHYFAMIQKMYELANRAVAFNMLTKANHIDNNTYAAYHPEEVVDFCESFADTVHFVDGYLPQDFTIYLQKNQS